MRRDLALCLLLVLAVLAVYGQAVRYDFVDFDDDQYVFENPHVRRGLTWQGVRWALTSTWAANWHPLTWLSHMLDCELWGLRAGYHHMTSVGLHALNSVLFYLVFARIASSRWRSAIVAALFALHPLHVESVAWVAERKDVLSTLFFLLTLWAYGAYASRPGPARYGLVFGLLALGLAAKPMLVTTPFVLLLLDVWPLGRLEIGRAGATLSRALVLVAEKVPLLVLSAASSVVTFVAQHQGGATTLTYQVSLGTRLANAAVSYVAYLAKALWPTGLAVFYPYRESVGPVEWLGAILLLGMVTVLVVRMAGRRGYLAMGWFWYLGMLVPVIGIVQVGEQAMADRYTYVPLVGVFVMVVWGLADLAARIRRGRICAGVATGLVLAGCIMAARVQVAYWRSGVSLLEHALEAAGPSALVHNNLGVALHGAGRREEAIQQYREALRFKPGYARAHYNLGISLAEQGKTDEAIREYREAIRLNPGFSNAYTNLGTVLAEQGRHEEAIQAFNEALRIEPTHVAAHYNLGISLARQGRREEAAREFREAIRLEPENPAAVNDLAWMRATHPDPGVRDGSEAVLLAERAVVLAGRTNPNVLDTLAAAYAEAGRFGEAVATQEEAVRAARAAGLEGFAKDLENRLALYRSGRPFREAGVPADAGGKAGGG